MIAGAGAGAAIGEHGAKALVGRRQFRVDPERGIVMRARVGVFVGAKQQVGEVDMRQRICRMVQDRLNRDPAGGVDRATYPSAASRIR